MSDINTCGFTGRLGNDPELKYSAGGEAYLNLSMAVGTRAKKPTGEWVDETIWLRVTMFGKRAEGFAKIARKGMRVGASGELRVRQYETKDNVKGTSVELGNANVVPLDSKPQDGSERPRQQTGGQSGGGRQVHEQSAPDHGYGSGPVDYDDVPF